MDYPRFTHAQKTSQLRDLNSLITAVLMGMVAGAFIAPSTILDVLRRFAFDFGIAEFMNATVGRDRHDLIACQKTHQGSSG
jgi:hypothetical protein